MVTGDYEAAQRNLLAAKHTEPQSSAYADWCELLAEIYERHSKQEDAIHEYKECVEREPRRAHNWARLAQLYERTGRFEEAIQSFREAVFAALIGRYPLEMFFGAREQMPKTGLPTAAYSHRSGPVVDYLVALDYLYAKLGRWEEHDEVHEYLLTLEVTSSESESDDGTYAEDDDLERE